jgi:hypothetical protein
MILNNIVINLASRIHINVNKNPYFYGILYKLMLSLSF